MFGSYTLRCKWNFSHYFKTLTSNDMKVGVQDITKFGEGSASLQNVYHLAPLSVWKVRLKWLTGKWKPFYILLAKLNTISKIYDLEHRSEKGFRKGLELKERYGFVYWNGRLGINLNLRVKRWYLWKHFDKTSFAKELLVEIGISYSLKIISVSWTDCHNIL